MPGIVIIGSEGSGKTVLLTVLCKLYGPRSDRQLRLNPCNRATAEYVERCWQTLRNQEWPASTPPGHRHQLKWIYEFEDGSSGTLRLLDCAGQDLRQLFADERILDEAQLPTSLRALAETIRTADAVMLLVNLRDFLGEPDPIKRLANEWLIRCAMEYRYYSCPAGAMCLVFTQADLYREQLKAEGDLSHLAWKYLPHVSDRFLRGGNVPLMRVSSVGATVVKPDEAGRPRRVPDGKLHCKGFSALVQWMADNSVDDVLHQHELPAQSPAYHSRVDRTSPSSQVASPNIPHTSSQEASDTKQAGSIDASGLPIPWFTFSAEQREVLGRVAVWVVFILVSLFVHSCNRRAEQRKQAEQHLERLRGGGSP